MANGTTASFLASTVDLFVQAPSLSRLRSAGPREIFVFRAHLIDGWPWVELGLMAEHLGAALTLVVHASAPSFLGLECLKRWRLRTAVPREIRLTTDERALAVGIPPRESYALNPAARVLRLLAAPPPNRKLSARARFCCHLLLALADICVHPHTSTPAIRSAIEPRSADKSSLSARGAPAQLSSRCWSGMRGRRPSRGRAGARAAARLRSEGGARTGIGAGGSGSRCRSGGGGRRWGGG